MIPKSYLQLIRDIITTESPYTRKEYITTYCLLEGRDNDPNDLLELLNTCQAIIDLKKQQGKSAHTDKPKSKTKSSPNTQFVSKKKVYKSYKHPRFYSNYNGFGICASCKQVIEKGSPAFFHHIDGKITLYCAIPSCFPEEHKSNMLSNDDYINWCKPK